ncbi:hypothetical protein ATI61_10663 [Archangium gephyra]|uniref:Uncharacterized protein n=1 Tax=Archangium gephyra TaxID=48 RepID=A0AAC8TAC6_9BACT|nr:hypothetical protein [Archangium gephyra]AKI98666.1 Hypothetical protein AA314_00293 [Archangium gephyra]REG30594.1 hypothetical protein ATI61_10663 [Archangium gephyra]
MRRTTGLLPLCLTLWLATPALARDLVQLPAGQVYSVKVDADVRTLWIALTAPAGGTLNGLDVGQKPIDVGLGDWHDNALREAFTATLSESSPGQHPGIALKVELAQLPQPGTYDVQLSLKQGQEQQFLKLQVVVPEAKLREQAAPLMERVIYPFFGVKDTPGLFTLSETSGRSRVTNLSIQPVTAATSGETTLTGHLRFDTASGNPPVPVVIPPGGAANIPYSVSGDFPVGTAKGSVELRSPQLQTPLTVTYEVRTRRTVLWVPILLLLGLLTGYLLRTWLKYQVELNEKRVAAESLRLKLEEERRLRPDPLYLASLAEVDAPLAQLQTLDVKGLSEQLPQAEQKFEAARAEFNKRQAETQARLTEAEQLLSIAWSLPPSVQETLGKAREALGASRKLLESNSVVAADQELKSQLASLAQRLREKLRAWRRSVDGQLARFDDAPLPLREQDQKTLSTQMEHLHDALRKIPLDAAQLDLRAVLSDTHDARTMLINTEPQLRDQLQRLLNGVRDVFDAGGVPLTGLEQELQEWSRQPSDKVEDELEWLINRSRPLERVLKQVMVAQLGSPLDEAARGLIDQRRYVDLAALVVKHKQETEAAQRGSPILESFSGDDAPTPPPAVAIPLPAVPTIPPVAFPETPRGLLGALPEALSRLLERLREPAAPVSPAVGHALAFKALLWARAARTLIAGIGILAVGYFLFAEKFTGTVQEMAAVFVWGFTIDVSVDALVDVMSKGIKQA